MRIDPRYFGSNFFLAPTVDPLVIRNGTRSATVYFIYSFLVLSYRSLCMSFDSPKRIARYPSAFALALSDQSRFVRRLEYDALLLSGSLRPSTPIKVRICVYRFTAHCIQCTLQLFYV